MEQALWGKIFLNLDQGEVVPPLELFLQENTSSKKRSNNRRIMDKEPKKMTYTYTHIQKNRRRFDKILF
jgi:hypothetical protein